MAERCGAQGHSTPATLHATRHPECLCIGDLNSVIITDSDVLALCIRLWCPNTLQIPAARDSLIAKHGYGPLDEARETLRHLPGVHRSESSECVLLPKAERAVVAQDHTCVRAAWVYRRYCLTCTSPLRPLLVL